MCYLVFVFLSGLTVFMLLIGSLLVRVMLDMPVFAGMNPCQLASENLHLLVLFLFCDLNHCSPCQDISYTNYEYTQYYLPYFSSYDCQAIYYMQLSFFDQDLQFQMQSNSYYFFIQDPENLLSICDSFWMMNVSEQPAFIIQSQQTKYQQQNTDYQYIVNYQAHLSYLIVQYSNAAKIVNLSCILPNVFVSIMKQSDKHNIKALSYAKSDVGYYKVNLKSQVWRHFKRNLAGQCRCNYCGMLFKQLHHSTNQMSAHLNKQHSVQIYGYNHPKREQEEFMTDLIQNLFIDGYPIDKIVDNLLKLFTSHGQQFEGLLQRFVGQLASKKQRIKQILEILPIDTDKRVIEQMITQFLPDLSKSARKCLLEQYFWIYSNQEQIILNFKEHGYDIINLYDNQNLNLMMLVTDSMKYMYQKYGDSLSIDLIDKVFKKKSPYGFSQYSTWFFTGQNQQLENVLFGFAIINEENQRNLEFMFDRFFKRMDYMYPISACIPPLTILQTHLQKHTPSTTLTTNWYHKLKFLSSSLQNQFPQQKQSIMSTICNCFRTQSYEQYKHLLHKIMSKISDQNVIKYGIQKCTQYCCIFNIPSNFIGFSIETWKYVQLESAVRQIFVYQDNLARVFIYVAKLDRNLNYAAFRELQQNYDSVFPSSIMDSNNCKKQPYQQLTPNHPSRPIPLPHPPTLSPNLLKRLELSIQELGTYKLQIIDPITVRIQSKKNHISKWKIYTICFNIQSDIWVCNCKYLFHTGIPCGHLIKVIEYFHGDYMWYVNSRWLG